jgi:hypothetical protein
MASQRAAKNNVIKPCMLFLLGSGVLIIILSVFFDSIVLKSSNQVTLPSNYKLIQKNMPKQVFPNNNIQKGIDLSKSADDIRIPARFAFGDPINMKPVKIQKMDINDKDCPINMELLEMNKKLFD